LDNAALADKATRLETFEQKVPMASFFGIYRGTILSTTDPAVLGRVQVMVPAVSGQVSGWALPCQSGGTTAPNVGDTAWIIFEGGDPTRPVFMGTMPTN
jgi:hypothetical protein